MCTSEIGYELLGQGNLVQSTSRSKLCTAFNPIAYIIGRDFSRLEMIGALPVNVNALESMNSG